MDDESVLERASQDIARRLSLPPIDEKTTTVAFMLAVVHRILDKLDALEAQVLPSVE